jgi:hypothetical protein
MNNNPPQVPQSARILRSVAIDRPRVTKFAIDWPSSGNSQFIPVNIVVEEESAHATVGEGGWNIVAKLSSIVYSLHHKKKKAPLPIEAWKIIFSQLEIVELAKCRELCTQFNQIINQGKNGRKQKRNK